MNNSKCLRHSDRVNNFVIERLALAIVRNFQEILEIPRSLHVSRAELFLVNQILHNQITSCIFIEFSPHFHFIHSGWMTSNCIRKYFQLLRGKPVKNWWHVKRKHKFSYLHFSLFFIFFQGNKKLFFFAFPRLSSFYSVLKKYRWLPFRRTLCIIFGVLLILFFYLHSQLNFLFLPGDDFKVKSDLFTRTELPSDFPLLILFWVFLFLFNRTCQRNFDKTLVRVERKFMLKNWYFQQFSWFELPFSCLLWLSMFIIEENDPF